MRSETKKGESSSPAPRAQAQTDGKKPSKGSGRRRESPSGKGGRIAFRRKCTNPSCSYWRPPVCLNNKPELGCKYGETFRFRHAEVDGQPSKKSKKCDAKRSVASLKESFQLGCVSQDSHPRLVHST